MNGEPTLPFVGVSAPARTVDEGVEGDIPLIYVASPLTRATDEHQQREITFGVDKIVKVIGDRTPDDCELIRTHAPAMLSAPWNGDHSPPEIFRRNSRLVLAESDAVIILALGGGSDGTGQELALANQRGIPVLRLSPSGEQISRQILGNPMLTAQAYRDPDELEVIVGQFLLDHRTDILDGPRRRRSRSLVYRSVQSDLQAAWSGQGPLERNRIAGVAGLVPAQVDHLLSHPLLVASMAHLQVLGLGVGLGIDVASYFTTSEDPLTIAQLEALIIAKDEFGWTNDETTWIRRCRGRELLSAGTKRLLLGSPADWLRLKETVAR